MADHTIWGSFDGALTQYIRPYIEVSWEQNLANNTSTVTASLYFHRYTNNYWTYNELTNSNGHSCTFRVGNSTETQIRPFNLQTNSPPNRVLIWTRTQTVSHNSAGNATVNISANGNTNVNPQHYSFGETITLPQIPRETTINSVSIDGSLSPNTSQGITLSVDRKHSSYTMDYQIYSGSTRISNTTGQGVRTSLTLTSSLVNSIIDTMPTTTTRKLQLRVITRDSSGKQVGTTQSRNFNVSLNSTNTRPTLSNIQASVAGSGTDSSKGIFVQGISRLYASFVTDAGHGASIKDRSITVSGQSFGSQHSTNSNRYDGNSSILNKTGNLTVTYKATNSRDQTTSTTRTITVRAYSTPRIETFSGSRNSSPITTITLKRRVTWSNLGSSNNLDLEVHRKTSTSSTWTSIHTQTATSGLVTSDVIRASNAETISYDFRLTVTDEFGNTARSLITVASAKVLMHYLKNDSVGIGRYSQGQAQLEVGGDIEADGDVTSGGVVRATNGSHVGSMTVLGTGNLVIDSSAGNDILLRSNTFGSGNVRLLGNDILVNTNATSGETSIIESGSNSNGDFIKFYDGTMICWGTGSSRTTSVAYGALYRSTTVWLNFAQTFSTTPSTVIVDAIGQSMMGGTNSVQASRCSAYIMSPVNGDSATLRYLAIGKWR